MDRITTTYSIKKVQQMQWRILGGLYLSPLPPRSCYRDGYWRCGAGTHLSMTVLQTTTEADYSTEPLLVLADAGLTTFWPRYRGSDK
jgi:hypothetical protein